MLEMSYVQVSRGRFRGELSGFSLPSGMFWHSQANVGVTGECGIPDGYLLVGLTTQEGDYWHDRPVTTGTMVIGNPSTGLCHRTGEFHGAWVWLLRQERYQELAESLGLNVVDFDRSRILFDVRPGPMSRLRELIRDFLSSDNPEFSASQIAWFEAALVRGTLQCLAKSEERGRMIRSTGRGRLVARAARDLLHRNCQSPLSMAELSGRLKVPERTLRAYFSKHFQISPASYHLCLRLNLVRRNLLLAVPEKGAVSRTATYFGFWHMGRFGQQYRAFFGEAPIETLRQETSFESWPGFELLIE